MNDKVSIDYLLSCFLDGELSPEQNAKIHKMLERDSKLRRKLEKLKKTRTLLNALPCEKAPDNMIIDIKASLERRTLLNANAFATEKTSGAAHLFVRRFLTFAAVFILFAALAFVIYNILGPKPISLNRNKIALRKNEITESSPTPEPKITPVVVAAESTDFIAELALKTDKPLALTAALKRAAKDNSIDINTTVGKDDVFVIHCSPRRFDLFVRDISPAWQNLQNAELKIAVDNEKTFLLADVSLKQILDLTVVENQPSRLTLARDFAIDNSLRRLNDSPESEPQSPLLLPAPQPVLTTGPQKKDNTESHDSPGNVKLTIKIISVE
jgi:hypothetical protein